MFFTRLQWHKLVGGAAEVAIKLSCKLRIGFYELQNLTSLSFDSSNM